MGPVKYFAFLKKWQLNEKHRLISSFFADLDRILLKQAQNLLITLWTKIKFLIKINKYGFLKYTYFFL